MNNNSFDNFIKESKKNHSTSSKKGLGRGLDALLGTDISQSIEKQEGIKTINVNNCEASEFQSRTTFNEEDLNTLASSIQSKGVLQPIIVRKRNNDIYEIIAGERRWRASKLAGLSNIPAIIVNLNNKEVMEVGLIENLQRSNLNPLEEARAYKKLYDDFNYTHEDISKSVGKNRTYITNFLRILTLPKEILTYIANEKISMGHAKILVGVDDNINIANKIVKEKLSVKQTETMLKDIKIKPLKNNKITPDIFNQDNDVVMWKNKLESSKEVKVNISKATLHNGKIVISYKNIDSIKDFLIN